MAKRVDKRNRKDAWTEHPSHPRLLPLKKAAEMLGLTTWAMRERIWGGQIPVVQFPGGRKQYVDIQDIETFIEQNKRIIK